MKDTNKEIEFDRK